MKGMSSHVMVIILSLILMLVVLAIGVNWVYGSSNIDWQKVWDLGPQAGTALNPNPDIDIHNIYGGGIGLDHIFSTGSTLDLSEIACYISDEIYKDYSKNGDKISRAPKIQYDKGYPFSVQTMPTEFDLMAYGTFNYSSSLTPSNSDPDETTLNTNHSGCHLCRDPPASGGTAILNLDEVCINLNLRDRLAPMSTTLHICNDPFYIGSSLVTFGNNDCGAARNPALPNWQSHCDGGVNVGYPNDDFCDNDKHKIAWALNRDQDTFPWNITDETFFGQNDDMLNNDGRTRTYLYGLLWLPTFDPPRYQIVFIMLPQPTSTSDGWSIIWNTTVYNQRNYRRNAFGKDFPEARTVTDVIIQTTQTINVKDIMDMMWLDFDIGTPVIVDFAQCNSPASCYPNWLTTPRDCVTVGGILYDDLQKKPIRLRINATDTSSPPKPVTSPNQAIPGGKYRITIREWYGGYDHCYFGGSVIGGYWCGAWEPCFDMYDRTVTINKL